MSQTKRGGLRTPPGGRPLKPEDERRVHLSVRVDPHTHRALKEMRATPTEGLGAVIDRLVTQQKEGTPCTSE